MTENAFTEYACRFGERRRLTGVITEPAGAAPGAAVVLVNAGLTPKSGPFRLYAQLARRLARQGVLTLRFDLGGIGDSGQGGSSLPLEKRTELEIRAALDHLCEGGRRNGVVVGGLCSGAEDSFRFAELDPRVGGLLLIDPFGYRTPGWRARDLAIRAARRALWRLGLLPTYAAAQRSAGLIDYEHMERSESSRILRALIARRVRMHFVYTGGMRESFNHKGQFKAMFAGIDFQGLVTLDYFPRLRHTQVLEEDRREVVESIVRNLPALSPERTA